MLLQTYNSDFSTKESVDNFDFLKKELIKEAFKFVRLKHSRFFEQSRNYFKQWFLSILNSSFSPTTDSIYCNNVAKSKTQTHRLTWAEIIFFESRSETAITQKFQRKEPFFKSQSSNQNFLPTTCLMFTRKNGIDSYSLVQQDLTGKSFIFLR